MKSHCILRALPLSLLLSACVESIDVGEFVETTDVIFSPSTGTLPLPNDLLFLDTTDLTLNLSAASDPTQQGVVDAMNALDGWSTTSPITFSFDGPIDGNLLSLASEVRLFRVVTLGQLNPTDEFPPIGTPVLAILSELTPGLDFMTAPVSDVPSNTSIAVIPLAPLRPATSYMLVVTDGILDEAGVPVSFGTEYELARHRTPYPSAHPLRGLQELVNAMEDVAEDDALIDRDDIVLTLTFTTQSIGSGLDSTFAIANGDEAGVISTVCGAGIINCSGDTDPDPSSGASFSGAPTDSGTTNDHLFNGGTATVVQEALSLPYYLTGPSNSGGTSTLVDLSNPTSGLPLSTWWESRYPFHAADTDRHVTAYNPIPSATRVETIPVLITTPPGAPPVGGWPCVIYQHGVLLNRGAMFSVADPLANAGFACISIDLPLHGIPQDALIFSQLSAGYDTDTVHERLFGLDLIDNASGAAGPDGLADPSGAHFLDFTSFRTNRDNLRQAVTDLFNLTAALGSLDVWHTANGAVGADGNPDIDTSQLHFIANSLGAIVGVPFLSIQESNAPAFTSTTLCAPAGGIPGMLVGSVVYGPIIEAKLAALGIFPGSDEWIQLLLAAQTVTDTADGVNYATSFNTGGASGTALHVIEYVGGGNESGVTMPSDTVFPNLVLGAPLSGTDPLVALMGLTQVSTTSLESQAVVKFQEGTHSSFVNPDIDGDNFPDVVGVRVMTEAQTQAVLFAVSGGTNVVITDEPLISPNPQP